MSAKTPIFVSRPGPIIHDPPTYSEGYTGPISDAERKRLQPLTTAVLKARGISATLAVITGLGLTVALVAFVECCTRAIERRHPDVPPNESRSE